MLNNPLQPIITIKQVLDILFDKSVKEPFAITFISFDKNRKKGGDIIMLDSCFVPRSEHIAREKKIAPELPVTFLKKNPNHIEHNTVNLAVSGSDKLVKVHIDLITEFNKKRVVW